MRIPRFSSWLCDRIIRVPVFPAVKIGIIYHCFRLAWPLLKDDTPIREVFHKKIYIDIDIDISFQR